jgi:DNA-binding protein HU-beta
MNRTELIEALAGRLGDKRTATAALDAVLGEIQAQVTKGERVAITGFGVFEKRVRGARTARNPRTGEAVKVRKTSVPAFRAGANFKDMVSSGRAPKAAALKKSPPARKAATKAAGTKISATRVRATTTRSARTTDRAHDAGLSASRGHLAMDMKSVRTMLGSRGRGLTPDVDRQLESLLGQTAPGRA